MTPLDVPAQLIAELAIGADNPEEVASRFGFTGKKWKDLQRWKPFLDAVEAQRIEFERSGYTFKVKSAMKADALSDAVFVQSMRNDTPIGQRLDALKLFAKLGELEPTPKAAASGPAFSITIDLSGAGTTSGKNVVTVTTKPETSLEVEDAVHVQENNMTSQAAEQLLTAPDFDTTPTP
jgi:hypothetical protein